MQRVVSNYNIVKRNDSYIITLTTDTAEETYTIPSDEFDTKSFPGVVLRGDTLYINDRTLETYPYTMTTKPLDSNQSKSEIPTSIKDQSDRDFLQELLALEPDMKITVTSPEAAAAPSSNTQGTSSKASQNNASDSALPNKVLGVDPYTLATVNNESIVKSVDMPSAKNNNTTTIVLSNPKPKFEYVIGYNGRTMFYKDDKMLDKSGSDQADLRRQKKL